MDKQTLSNYGWIVIAVLVLAVMIALATPFGKYVESGVRSTTAGLFETSEKALNVVGMSAEGEKQNIINEIPEGAIFTHSDGTPADINNLQQGDIFIYDGYEYHYMQKCYVSYETADYDWDNDETIYIKVTRWKNISDEGWGCCAIDENASNFAEFCDIIFKKPLINLDYAFYECANLVSVPKIPNTVTSMEYTFAACTSLVEIKNIPNNITCLNATFTNCTSLVSVPKLPDSILDLTDAFNGCSSLKNLYNLPSNLHCLLRTFSQCSSLVSIPKIPDSTTELQGAFHKCTSMTQAPALPKNAQSLYCAFQYSGIVVTPQIPDKVTNMGYTFYGCENLIDASNIIFPEGTKNLDSTFKNCTNLIKAPIIPSQIYETTYTFANCKSLTGTIIINATKIHYYRWMFDGTVLPIILTGSSTQLQDFANTSSAQNITIK